MRDARAQYELVTDNRLLKYDSLSCFTPQKILTPLLPPDRDYHLATVITMFIVARE